MSRTVNPLRQLDQCQPEAQETEETIFFNSLQLCGRGTMKKEAVGYFSMMSSGIKKKTQENKLD